MNAKKYYVANSTTHGYKELQVRGSANTLALDLQFPYENCPTFDKDSKQFG